MPTLFSCRKRDFIFKAQMRNCEKPPKCYGSEKMEICLKWAVSHELRYSNFEIKSQGKDLFESLITIELYMLKQLPFWQCLDF
jgi:hypothetical protein